MNPRTAPISTDLHALAAELGVTIAEHHGGPKGYYDHDRRLISLRADLRDRARRATLAHELGHAAAGDQRTGVDWLDQRAERRADEYAARLLISPEAYRAAEAERGPHLGAIARELGVTVHLVTVWRDMRARSRI